MADTRYPYAEHDDGVVLTQPEPGKFHRRPMTTGELAAREPALKIAKDIYRHANQAGVCYFEFWRLIADAIDAARSVPSAVVAPFDKSAADRMAAAVDVMIRRNVLDPRSLVADARLDYGQPFDNAEEIVFKGERSTIPYPHHSIEGKIERESSRSHVATTETGAGRPWQEIKEGVLTTMEQPSSTAYDYTQGDDEGDETYTLRLVDRAIQLERELASAKRDADHFYQLSGKYLEQLNAEPPKAPSAGTHSGEDLPQAGSAPSSTATSKADDPELNKLIYGKDANLWLGKLYDACKAFKARAEKAEAALSATVTQEELDEAKAIFTALSREYNRDEQCDYKKINGLIERGEVFLSDGAKTSRAYWACWGGGGTPTEEDRAEYKRYAERCMARRADGGSQP